MSTEYSKHPDIAILADYEAGLLPGEDEKRIKAHLSDCPFCRLELKRLRRFRTIEEDKELAGHSQWEQAEDKLDKAFREKIIPRVIAEKENKVKVIRSSRFVKWLVPVAAAAAVVLLVSRIGDTPGTSETESLRGTMRGSGTEKELIIPETPAGEVDTLTGSFVWKSEKAFDYFLLEVFTSNLKSVYQSGKIEDTLIVVPDSIKAAFNKDRIYIWNVRGFKGVEKGSVSKNEWFKVIPKGEK